MYLEIILNVICILKPASLQRGLSVKLYLIKEKIAAPQTAIRPLYIWEKAVGTKNMRRMFEIIFALAYSGIELTFFHSGSPEKVFQL